MKNWSRSRTRANDKGPRIDSTTKKNVRSVSRVSPAALNNNSKKSRTSCQKPALLLDAAQQERGDLFAVDALGDGLVNSFGDGLVDDVG